MERTRKEQERYITEKVTLATRGLYKGRFSPDEMLETKVHLGSVLFAMRFFALEDTLGHFYGEGGVLREFWDLQEMSLSDQSDDCINHIVHCFEMYEEQREQFDEEIKKKKKNG